MLDIPGAAALDKQRLIGGRVRADVDPERLFAEVAALPDPMWGKTGVLGGAND